MPTSEDLRIAERALTTYVTDVKTICENMNKLSESCMAYMGNDRYSTVADEQVKRVTGKISVQLDNAEELINRINRTLIKAGE